MKRTAFMMSWVTLIIGFLLFIAKITFLEIYSQIYQHIFNANISDGVPEGLPKLEVLNTAAVCIMVIGLIMSIVFYYLGTKEEKTKNSR